MLEREERASLVPAAAVIPALLVYAKVAAVKALLFGIRVALEDQAYALCLLGLPSEHYAPVTMRKL